MHDNLRVIARDCGASMSSGDEDVAQGMVLFRNEQLAEYTRRIARECAALCRAEAQRLYDMRFSDHSALALKAEDLENQILKQFHCIP